LPTDDPFVAALTAYRAVEAARRIPAPLVEAKRNEVFRQFLVNPRVQRMAAKYEYELNLHGDRSEIVQGMALVFLDKYLDTLDEPANVYTLLYPVAQHVALTVKGSLLSHRPSHMPLTEPDADNHRSLRPVEQELPLGEPQALIEAAAEDFTHRVEEEIDRRRAEAKLAERLRALDPALRARIERAGAAPERRPRGPHLPTAEARELLDIRDRLHLDNRDYAKALGIDHPLLCAYLYGRTKKIRDSVMAEARNLYRNRGRERGRLLNGLNRRSMRRIVEGWLRLLGESPARPGFSALAMIFGINWHTVRRWHGEEFKPPLEKLAQLECKVKAAARRRGLPAGKRSATVASAVRGRHAGTTGAGSRRRPAARTKTSSRSKAAGNRRPSAGQTTASRRSSLPRATKKRGRAMTEVTSTPAAPAKARAPRKPAVKRAAKKAVRKTVAKKTVRKVVRKTAAKKAVKKAVRKVVLKKVARKAVAKKAVRKAVVRKAVRKAAK
jgi:hypothetical protein